jgi:outer membrane protein OmpA-like peptidoglycan-associated protein/Tol biopolymer transport system component
MILKLRSLTLIGFFLLGPILSFAQETYLTSDKKAIKYFEEALEFFQRRDYEGTLYALDKSIERDPTFYEAWELQSQCYFDMGDPFRAAESLGKALEISKDYRPINLYFMGEFRLNEGAYAEAKSYFSDYLSFQSQKQKQVDRATEGLKTCEFALEQLDKPVLFDPKNLGKAINTSNPEYLPCLTADDNLMLFTRRIRDSNSPEGMQDDLFYSIRDTDGNWSIARSLSSINTPLNEGAASISADGSTLVFTSCERFNSYGPGKMGYGSCDLFIAYRTGDGWSPPQNMGKSINTGSWESQPSISSDGREIFFIRAPRRRVGEVNQDIYTSKRGPDNSWSVAEKLPPIINSKKREETVLIHPDGQSLYFSSNGHLGMGGLDLFVSRKDSLGDWSKPMNLGYPINTFKDENSLMVSTSGELAYFSSNAEGGFGSFDIYGFELHEDVRPQPVTYVKGKVRDQDSEALIGASFELVDLGSGEVVYTSFTQEEDGAFLVPLVEGKNYAFTVEKEGYLFFSKHFDLNNVTDEPFNLEIDLMPIAPGKSMVLQNVFFDLDKSTLKQESKMELNRLVELMNSNPTLSIVIEGHTDTQGSATYNQTLSNERAMAVYMYLVGAGISKERLSYKGYGATQPIASNDTEAGRAQNRRTAFRIENVE